MEDLHTRSQLPRRCLPCLLAGRRGSSEKARSAEVDGPSQGIVDVADRAQSGAPPSAPVVSEFPSGGSARQSPGGQP